MARADTYTLLPLDTYAKIMGLNPLHFNSARLPQVTPEPFTAYGAGSASGQIQTIDGKQLWQQFEWQDPSSIGREELARLIQQAEFDIAEYLGYFPAPVWISQEYHKYPREHRAEMYGSGINTHGQVKGIKTNYGKIISPGRRDATTLIGTPTVVGLDLVYSDPNVDGWDTLATITLATTVTDECEIKLYYPNESGAQEWEIRPLKNVSISGGVVTITVDSWLLFTAAVMEAIPTGEVTSIDASTGANYLQSVEVRREYTNFTEASAQFFWEREAGGVLLGSSIVTTCTSCGGLGCEGCTLLSQNGCFTISNAEVGFGAPVPATYDDTDERWEKDQWDECREPDAVKLWYYCGDLSQNNLGGASCTQLDNTLARNIAILATARMPGLHSEKSVSPIANKVAYYTRDLAESGGDTNTIFTPPDILNNPFGTRRGEAMVYKSLMNMRKRRVRMSVVMA